jgi:hypothetical protein
MPILSREGIELMPENNQTSPLSRGGFVISLLPFVTMREEKIDDLIFELQTGSLP